MSIFVKICGIVRQQDADVAIEAGTDAVGFNFYRSSPRFLDATRAAAIRTDGVLRVGVFVNASPKAVHEIAACARIDIVQLHGDEKPADYAPHRVWKAYRVTPGWTPPPDTTAEAFVLDGPAPGTGVAFDWSQTLRTPVPFLIAGGLDPDNVAEAIRLTRPWGVDACSRLEASPGIKDPEKVARFIQAVRAAAI